MTPSAPDDESARRALTQRLQRFLDAVEKEDRALGPWETDRLSRIMGCLEVGYYRVGMDLLIETERPDLYRTPKDVADVAHLRVLTVAKLRSNLAKVLAKIAE